MLGYMGKLCRVNLSTRTVSYEYPSEAVLRSYIGGTGLGIYYLYKEVPRDAGCFDPENRIILMSGPLGGAPCPSALTSLVTKGPMGEGASAAQCAGKLGAFMRFCGLDGIIVQGVSDRWVYIHISDDGVELRDAEYLVGMDTWDTEEAIENELEMNEKCLSCMTIGPAGEHLVRFAATCTDRGHIAAHNGPGAVFGSKKLKAIAAERGSHQIKFADIDTLVGIMHEGLGKNKATGDTHLYGTSRSIIVMDKMGVLPIKNYSFTDIDGSDYYGLDGVNSEELFEKKHIPCYGCAYRHCMRLTVKDGPYKGWVGEEAEYEIVVAAGSAIGQKDAVWAQMLANHIDRMCMDGNEMGWLIGWVMECYEKGIATKDDLDGIEMNWGDAEATKKLITKIAYRDGIGDKLAEGVMRSACKLWGGKGEELGIFTYKGNTPRGHDHRQLWNQVMDTALGSYGQDEVGVLYPNAVALGLPADTIKDTAEGCAAIVAACANQGTKILLDSVPTCFIGTTRGIGYLELMKLINAATGWDIDENELKDTALRISNLLKAFGIRNGGHTKEMDRPSARYGAAAPRGMDAGKSINEVWEQARELYYEQRGWDRETGKPLPETLEALGLSYIVPDLWENSANDAEHAEKI